jgi:glucose/arabinose dehydrogenase
VLVALLGVAGWLGWRAWQRVGWVRAVSATTTELPAAARRRASRRGGPPPADVRLEEVARGLERPLFVTHAGDGSGRLFVVEQGGMVRVVRDGRLLAEPFLDATRLLDSSGGERGLLGLAFAPDFPRSGRFFIAHTAPGPAVRITRLRVAADPDRADPGSATTVLEMDDPAGNHNGGMLAFGPDGMLWHGTGDGGAAGDPWGNAKSRDSLLGKLLRLDVGAGVGGPPAAHRGVAEPRRRPGQGAGDAYAIPPDNPFASGGGRPEIWALGLRNPWRFSFDRATGELWIGDVGQYRWEEIDVADARAGGLDFGWNTMEGRHCFLPARGCDPAGLVLPVHEYGHDEGCSVTGGYVYRGRAIPALAGAYLFSDYCTGTLWALTRGPSGTATVSVLLDTGMQVSSFGEDEAGEVYVCDHRGGVYRLVPAP